MNSIGFNDLVENDKLKTINNEGIFLSSIDEGRSIMSLYQLFNFFVEVSYNHSLKKHSHIHAFTDVNQLDRYLETVDISQLFAA